MGTSQDGNSTVVSLQCRHHCSGLLYTQHTTAVYPTDATVVYTLYAPNKTLVNTLFTTAMFTLNTTVYTVTY